MNEKKTIGNVNVLDIRAASEESIASIGAIGNANIVLYTRETAGLLSKLSFGNLNASIEAPSDNTQLLMSKSELNADYFQRMSGTDFLVVIGKLLVQGDVSAEDIDQRIAGIALIGKIICPQNLLGVLQAKTKFAIGKYATYPVMKHVLIGDLNLDETAIRALEDHSELAVIGSIKLPGLLDNNLIAEKIARLYATEEVTCHEENALAVQRLLHKDSARLRVIPAGFEWVEEEISLDVLTLAQKKDRKLYACGKVQIEADVTPSALDEGLAALISVEAVFCPLGLKETLLKKIDPLKTRAVFYEGQLWEVDGEETLGTSFFEALDGKVTLVVNGLLTLAPDVDARLLAQKLAKVHNRGAIHCRPEQMGVLQLRLGIKEGAIVDSSAPPENSEPEEFSIGNANYLPL